MSESIHWLEGVAKSQLTYNFCFELIEDAIKTFGGEEVFLKATDSFYPDVDFHSLPMLSKREEYLATELTDDDAVAKLFADHKEAIYRAIDVGADEYGEDAMTNSIPMMFDIDETACDNINKLIENDTLEDHPELLLAVTRFVCTEVLRQTSIFLEYGYI